MKLDVSKLPEGRRIEFCKILDPLVAELDIPGVSFKGSLEIDASIVREFELISADVSIKGECQLACHRCFREFQKPLVKMMKLTYPLENGVKFVELDQDIRDEIILSYPGKVLCREDCRGLCVKCGADLNNEKCKCK